MGVRKFGHQVIEWLGGKRIHPAWIVPRGVAAPPTGEVRNRILATVPEALAAVERAIGRSVDGPLAGAQLEALAFEVELSCACGFSGPLGHDDLIGGSMTVCPACGNVSTRPRVAELELVEIRTAP